jgi:hypothetical protein
MFWFCYNEEGDDNKVAVTIITFFATAKPKHKKATVALLLAVTFFTATKQEGDDSVASKVVITFFVTCIVRRG